MNGPGIAIAVSGLLAGGCLNVAGPDVGPLATMDAGLIGCAGDSDPAISVSYQANIVDGVFRTGKCVSCHSSGGIGLDRSGLDVSTYARLRAGGRLSGEDIVVDAMPCASIIVQKIESPPPFGRRMPYNGPYLSNADITLLRDWIAEGALAD